MGLEDVKKEQSSLRCSRFADAALTARQDGLLLQLSLLNQHRFGAAPGGGPLGAQVLYLQQTSGCTAAASSRQLPSAAQQQHTWIGQPPLPETRDSGCHEKQLRSSSSLGACGRRPGPSKQSATAAGRQLQPGKQTAPQNQNSVYVKRYRQRRKQLAAKLQETLAQRKQELAQLQQEQRQLCTKWEALQEVLHAQDHVLQLLQNLHISPAADLPVCTAAAEHDGVATFPVSSSGTQDSTAAPNCTNATAAGAHSNAASTGTAVMAIPTGDMNLQTASAVEPNASLAAHTAGSCDAASLDVAVKAMQVSPVAVTKQAQQQLLQQAKQFLQPIKLYTLKAASALRQMGKLPDVPAAKAALAAAQACPEALAAAAMSQAAVVDSGADSGAGPDRPPPGPNAKQQQQAPEKDNNSEDGFEVQFPYRPDMYITTPEKITDLCWPMNMSTWQIDDANNHQHTEQAAKAMWGVLRPEKWRALQAAWQTMGHQLQQVQMDLLSLRNILQTLGEQAQEMEHSRGSSSADNLLGSCKPQPYSGVDEYASSSFRTTSHEYAALAVQIEQLLMRENAISHQICGATLNMLTPLEVAVAFVSSWPYHPQVFTMFDIILKLGEPTKHM